MKIEEKYRAKELRINDGMSIRKISKILNVSRNRIAIWLKDFPLTEIQKKILTRSNPRLAQQTKASKILSDKYRFLRIKYREEGKIKAKEQDPLHIQGCFLYWAEGTKSKNAITFSNTDSNMIVLFSSFLRKFFDVKNDDFSIYLNCYVDNNYSIEEIENYWLNKLNISKKCLRKHSIKTSNMDNGKKNKHPFGVCVLRVNKSVSIVQHIYGAIQEYAGFDNDYCLG